VKKAGCKEITGQKYLSENFQDDWKKCISNVQKMSE
jgi:hypothetical protein